jgi:outer membrane protein TolC
MKDRKWATPGVRVATTVLALAFASSLSSFADGQVVTLSQSVAQALANGPDMRISRANLGLARDQFNDAASANGLGVSGNLGYDRAPFTTGYSQSGQPIQVVQNTFQGGLTMSAPLSTSVSLEGSHSITEASILDQATNVSLTASAAVWDGYRGGQALAAARIAAFTLQGTESSESASQKTVVYNVKQAYYTLLGQQRQIAILQQTLAQREAELQKTQSLYDARNVSQIDLKQAQVNRLQASLDLSKARGLLEVDREQLSNMMGVSTDSVYDVEEVPDAPAPRLDAAAAMKTAIANREDFRQIQLSLLSSDVSLALKKALAGPTVSVSTGVSWMQDWTTSNNRTTWHAGVSVQAPVIDAGSLGAQVREATLQKEKLRVQQGQLASAIATSVKSAVYTLQDLLSRVELARQSLDLAQVQYELDEAQFANGVISHLDVLTASVALTTARVNMAAAQSSAQLGVLALQSAMGE